MLVEWPPRTPVFYELARCLSCLRLIPPRRGGTIASIGTGISATGGGQRDWRGFEMDDSYSVLVCGLLLDFQQAASDDSVRFPSTSSGRGREGFQRATAKPFGRLRRGETPATCSIILEDSAPAGAGRGLSGRPLHSFGHPFGWS